jgi:hypothetical protein
MLSSYGSTGLNLYSPTVVAGAHSSGGEWYRRTHVGIHSAVAGHDRREFSGARRVFVLAALEALLLRLVAVVAGRKVTVGTSEFIQLMKFVALIAKARLLLLLVGLDTTFHHVILQSEHHSSDDGLYGPCNQSATPRE